jgi:hypothetical protein
MWQVRFINKILFGILTISIFVFVFLVPVNVLAVDQIKTVQFFVGGSSSFLSNTTTNNTFTVYIGDNLTGVTSPVKSAFFIISGVYTGGSGNLSFTINSDNSTLAQFALPSVSSPTPFEIIYKDSLGKINPASSGSYQYTLNTTISSGVTVYGLGAKIYVTYRFAPPSCPEGQPANEKIKTIKTFVGGSNTAVSGSVNSDFSIYIGDNITDVSNPIKSMFFRISGVYTSASGGSVEMRVNSQSATAKIFYLPAVSAPTPFEIIYKDSQNTINPSSPGIYSYQLNLTASGVTIYGLGEVAMTTYRYKPSSCGFPVYGDLISAVFDTTGVADGPAYNSIFWKGNLGGPSQNQGRVKFQLATSDSPSGPWNFIGGDTCQSGDWYLTSGPSAPVEITCASANHNNQRYFKYKIRICSADCIVNSNFSPVATDVIVNWSP